MSFDFLSYAEILDVVDRVAKLDDDAVISPELAALYLGVSEKTLARLRQTSSGPVYTQYQECAARSRNQKVNYIMRDLRSYRNSRRVSGTIEAAVVRGMAFVTMTAIQTSQPFFIKHGKIVHHVFTCTKSQFAAYITHKTSICWLTWQAALALKWSSKDPIEAVVREKYTRYILRDHSVNAWCEKEHNSNVTTDDLQIIDINACLPPIEDITI